jgi:hypothetical protein
MTKNFKISETKEDVLVKLMNDDVISHKDELRLRSADILLLPHRVFIEVGEKWVFPENTNDFYNYLDTKIDKVTTNLDIAEGKTGEIQQHSLLIQLADLVVSSGAYPILINLVSSYVYDWLNKKNLKSRDIEVKVSITTKGKTRTKTIEYKGPAEAFSTTMIAINDLDE